MRRSCTFVFKHSPSEKVSDVVGYIKGKSALMIHDKYPESVNGWSKAFWARGYYVATVGNITEDAVVKLCKFN